MFEKANIVKSAINIDFSKHKEDSSINPFDEQLTFKLMDQVKVKNATKEKNFKLDINMLRKSLAE